MNKPELEREIPEEILTALEDTAVEVLDLGASVLRLVNAVDHLPDNLSGNSSADSH